MSINTVTISGRLGQAPRRQTIPTRKGDTDVCFISVAVDVYEGKERGNVTHWVDVAVFRQHTAKFLLDYADKGDAVVVKGMLTTKTSGEGSNKRTELRLSVRGARDHDVELYSKNRRDQAASNNGHNDRSAEHEADLDDEIPF